MMSTALTYYAPLTTNVEDRRVKEPMLPSQAWAWLITAGTAITTVAARVRAWRKSRSRATREAADQREHDLKLSRDLHMQIVGEMRELLTSRDQRIRENHESIAAIQEKLAIAEHLYRDAIVKLEQSGAENAALRVVNADQAETIRARDVTIKSRDAMIAQLDLRVRELETKMLSQPPA